MSSYLFTSDEYLSLKGGIEAYTHEVAKSDKRSFSVRFMTSSVRFKASARFCSSFFSASGARAAFLSPGGVSR